MLSIYVKYYYHMDKNMKSTRQLLFENIKKLEPKTVINEGVLQEELQKELRPIDKLTAKRLFKFGNVIYIQHGSGTPDSGHNLFSLRKDKKDASMNMYTGGLKPEMLGLDYILDWVKEKNDDFEPILYTLFSPEFWIIENGEVIKDDQPQQVKEVSRDLINRASDAMVMRGQDRRADNLKRSFDDREFLDFRNKPIFGDEIIFGIHVENRKLNISHGSPRTKQYNTTSGTITYDIDNDTFGGIPYDMNRNDARLLSMIAMKVNPNTKYKNGTGDFKISGY